ncbi:hypothetical protein HNQ07_000226 [Deinococcus metalli]|uniref:Uncharacterized protein n=1 Tax=Deinococcus metalli TaxID=1141878 RepID=A0A7W8NQ53_9DEIO|nr:hypothetical protein [Deinococcus metalli]MBB5374782.1 hypothetical protein [Deinococcus metalli]GHF33758.1 hypothetical protein GCM10017781_08160 [Deinococcus metalli]
MNIDEHLSTGAVLERLGAQSASDYEAAVMRDVLLERFSGRDLDGLSEPEWLSAFGEMNRRKTTGWLKDEADNVKESSGEG